MDKQSDVFILDRNLDWQDLGNGVRRKLLGWKSDLDVCFVTRDSPLNTMPLSSVCAPKVRRSVAASEPMTAPPTGQFVLRNFRAS